MTGQRVFGPPGSGTWTLLVRGPTFRTHWEEVRFNSTIPEGTVGTRLYQRRKRRR